MASLPDLPPKDTNNLWYLRNDSSTAVVFVHGILSDSRSCWLSKATRSETYWPQLIADDERLQNPSIFLGGFYTAVDAGKFDIADCAKELFGGLTTLDRQRRSPPIEKRRLIFICHSTGGIIARYMLLNNADRFRDKGIGLVLIASPSFGSRLADQLGGLADFYDNQLGRHLRWGNDLLKDLDDRFKEFIDRKTIRNLVGIEAYENHFIIHRKWLPGKLFVVERESAGRYFPSRMLPNTDHFSIVKPTSLDHPSHKLLVEFWSHHYGRPFDVGLQAILDASKKDMRARNLPYFTPALLLALLYPNGFASPVVNSVKPGLAEDLRNRFRHYLDVELPKTGAGAFVDFDWFDREDVRDAQELAQQENSSTITERILFKAILSGHSATVMQLKEKLGHDFEGITRETERRRYSAVPTKLW
jgi:hypothetical protein